MQGNYWISNPKKHNKNNTNPKDPKPTVNFQCVPPPRTPPPDVAPVFDDMDAINLIMSSNWNKLVAVLQIHVGHKFVTSNDYKQLKQLKQKR